jgi:putative methyltransferase (TIGR04325 family)
LLTRGTAGETDPVIPKTRREWKDLGRRLSPPILLDVVRRRRGESDDPWAPGFRGRYETFEAAQQAAGDGGYQTTHIIERTIQRTRQIQAEAAADSTRAPDGWTMQNLGAILFALRDRPRGPLRILDFGGGMGVHWFRLAPLLKVRGEVSWTVCETTAMARAGAQAFADPGLSFVDDLDRLEGRFDVVLASGALQYTEAPSRYLQRLCALTDALILNRVPFIDEIADRLTVQTVNSEVFRARLPAWFFSVRTCTERLVADGLAIKLRWFVSEDTMLLDGQTLTAQGLVALREPGRE